MRSMAGILSTTNSITKSARLASMTHQLVSRSSEGGRSIVCRRASNPRVATVAYTFRPAAKHDATTSAATRFVERNTTEHTCPHESGIRPWGGRSIALYVFLDCNNILQLWNGGEG